MRRSLELDNQEWQALEELAEKTNSTSTSTNSTGGQPSWRVLVKRIAGSEACRKEIEKMLYREWLDEVIFNWRNRWEDLPDNEVEAFEASLTTEERQQWGEFFEQRPQEKSDKKYHVTKNLHYRRALAEARRMGLEPHQEISLNHNTGVLVEMAKGLEAGKQLIDKWGFSAEIKGMGDPGSMWDVMAHRRDGDAIITLIGDDRGWDKDWEYYIVVGWSPRHIVNDNWGNYDPKTRQLNYEGWSPTASLM